MVGMRAQSSTKKRGQRRRWGHWQDRERGDRSWGWCAGDVGETDLREERECLGGRIRGWGEEMKDA